MFEKEQKKALTKRWSIESCFRLVERPGLPPGLPVLI